MEQVLKLKQICYRCHRKNHIGCSGSMFRRSDMPKGIGKIPCLCEHPYHTLKDNKDYKSSRIDLPWWIERSLRL